MHSPGHSSTDSIAAMTSYERALKLGRRLAHPPFMVSPDVEAEVLARSISWEPRRYGSPDKAEQSLADEPINEIKVLNLKACFGGPILEVL